MRPKPFCRAPVQFLVRGLQPAPPHPLFFAGGAWAGRVQLAIDRGRFRDTFFAARVILLLKPPPLALHTGTANGYTNTHVLSNIPRKYTTSSLFVHLY
jgi:hypothetical protein